ncbi:hypothetical protein ACFLZJ_00425 [Nanoarchaeota archaeon]
MKCNNCGNEIQVKVGTRVVTEGCKILTSLTTIATVQCDKCDNTFQVPISSKSLLSMKKDDE